MTKGREIIIFAKSQSPFDARRQYLDVSLTDSQARVSRFLCRIFHCFVDFSKIYLDYHWFLSLKSCRHMIFLHLESFENNLSIRFLNIPKTVFVWSNLLRKVKFFCTVMIYIFHDSCSFPYPKKLLKVSDHSVEEIQHDSTTLSKQIIPHQKHYMILLFRES